jgi:hypothetical protein
MRHIDYGRLMKAAGIADLTGVVDVTENMSGLETDPKDDWLYLGIRTLRDVAREKRDVIRSAACIGSGNGIDSIALLKLFPDLKRLIVTDILPDILPQIRENIQRNVQDPRRVQIDYVCGRDCGSVHDPVDLIYANLPLIMVDAKEIGRTLATTTLTDAQHYSALRLNDEDPLLTWSLLSQLGFLLSAKRKLHPGGSIVTLLGGRVPYDVLVELGRRAGLDLRERYCAFKKQSDAQFIREYAMYEQTHGVSFCFYDYRRASEIIRNQLHVSVPDIVPLRGDQLKPLIDTARLTARDALALASEGQSVGHIAFSFEAAL